MADKDGLMATKITQVAPEVWTDLRKRALDERRPVYELVNQALAEYLAKPLPAAPVVSDEQPEAAATVST